ncbi:AraC family transcriptional regulator [Pedobacter chitinilyticus]|uniref:AraC family transcriptional regulator n=1 Tax=Pedobacter chitinilyticus TaxID=2233776 RepID=A0A3S4RQN6_9SPHI|nr:helix-turn-helix domain-containing protein [Pedobacter chitinilyticus]RWU07626.1 AraC family transcriptional regulator [Pedobacter chitinilyticus]
MDVSFIRQLYIPVQPAVKSYGTVSYQEFLPHQQLQPYIYCYWQLKTNQKLNQPFTYRIVADGCIDIFFELNQPQENFVMGFCKKYTEFDLAEEFDYVGVRFLPSMFPQLFNVDASSISNKAVELKEVVPQVAAFIQSHLGANLDMNKVISLLNEFFLDLLSTANFQNDARFYNAIALIMKNYGVVDMTEIDTGLSHRQLRRLFNFYIGDSMKTFSKVVRFQNILRAKPSTQSLQQNKLFFDSGFFDQSHFIKDFKHFYGVTPSKAFGR